MTYLIKNFFIKIYRKILSKTIYRRNFKTHAFYNYYFSNPKKKYIVQVGGNDGVQNDPLRQYFKKKGNYKAIIFEPIQYYYKKLKELYLGRNDILIKKFYVSNEKKEKEIYYIKPQICDEINSKDQKNVWLHGLGSFDKNIPLVELLDDTKKEFVLEDEVTYLFINNMISLLFILFLFTIIAHFILLRILAFSY